jgi:hypothetical protein
MKALFASASLLLVLQRTRFHTVGGIRYRRYSDSGITSRVQPNGSGARRS